LSDQFLPNSDADGFAQLFALIAISICLGASGINVHHDIAHPAAAFNPKPATRAAA
jgi:hypothetical protein